MDGKVPKLLIMVFQLRFLREVGRNMTPCMLSTRLQQLDSATYLVAAVTYVDPSLATSGCNKLLLELECY
jgi:hypothetical protein